MTDNDGAIKEALYLVCNHMSRLPCVRLLAAALREYHACTKAVTATLKETDGSKWVVERHHTCENDKAFDDSAKVHNSKFSTAGDAIALCSQQLLRMCV